MNNLKKSPAKFQIFTSQVDVNLVLDIGDFMDIAALNAQLQNSNTNVDSIRGIEVVLEAFVKKIIELFGKNALLSAGYQIGAAPGQKIAQRILAARGNAIFTDPIEALVALFSETKTFYNIELIKVDNVQKTGPEVLVTMKNYCFLRSIIKSRRGLEMGGPLCRINKGYLETALKLLTGKRIELNRVGDDAATDQCIETLRFF
jgi:predicted hydrocarbon binding protein